MEKWLSEVAEEIPIESLPEAYQEVAQVFGVAGALRLAQHLGGVRVYFPKLDSLVRSKRDEHIRREFTGFNHRELARKFGLTETWIREVVRMKPGRLEQIGLFEQAV
jgi:Mor family transcriptional regulator